MGQYFDNPEPGTYVAKSTEAFRRIEDIKGYLKVFKVKEGLDYSSLTSAKDMFQDCKGLQSIDTSAFKNVTNAAGMFRGCESLQSIDTSVFTNVTNAMSMFSGCASLRSIDTSVFTSIRDAGGMFFNCPNIKTYIPSGNPGIDSQLDRPGARPVQSLTESYWKKYVKKMWYF